MTTWLGATLGVLGFGVSLVALVVSIRAFRRAGPLTDLQTRLAALELAERKGAQVAQTKARVRATLLGPVRVARILLENVGGAQATDADIEFLDERGSDVISPLTRQENLPIPRLEPDRSVTLTASLAMGRYPPFRIALSWTDPDGTRQRVEDVLYLRE